MTINMLLDALKPDGPIGYCHQPPGGRFTGSIIEPETLTELIATNHDHSQWLSVAVLDDGVASGRGRKEDIRRLMALPIDLDVKEGAFTSKEHIDELVDALIAILGHQPVMTVDTGHGLQPWFLLDADDPAWRCSDHTDPRWTDINTILARWGRFVRWAAEQKNATVDNVFEVSRVLRAPDSVNMKNPEHPVPVTVRAVYDDHEPITWAGLNETLNDLGFREQPEDQPDTSEPVIEWTDLTDPERSCAYATAIIEAIPKETPGDTGRHPWLLGQTARLWALHRYGCATRSDLDEAFTALEQRFNTLLADTRHGEPRQQHPNEFIEVARAMQAKVATWSETKLTAEFTNRDGDTHTHNAPLPELAPFTIDAEPGALVSSNDTELDRLISEEITRLHIRDEARRLYKQMQNAAQPTPDPILVRELLAQPLEPARYRVGELAPAGGNTMINAQAKAGKTTLLMELARCLKTGDDFLGRFPVEPVDGRVLIIDLELNQQTLQEWAHRYDLDPDGTLIWSLRGRAGQFASGLLDPPQRAHIAQQIRDLNVDVIILDPLSVLLNAAGIQEKDNSEVGEMLRAGLTALTVEAEVGELFIAHHSGHHGERSRGASVLMDWPDALWQLIRQTSDNDDEDGFHPLHDPRYLSARGRDVDFPETRLTWNSETHRLTIEDGAGNRRQTFGTIKAQKARREHKERILEAIRDNGGTIAGHRRLREALNPSIAPNYIRNAVTELRSEGRITVEKEGQTDVFRTASVDGSKNTPKTPSVDGCGRVNEPPIQEERGRVWTGVDESENVHGAEVWTSVDGRLYESSTPSTLTNPSKQDQNKDPWAEPSYPFGEPETPTHACAGPNICQVCLNAEKRANP